MTGLRIGLLGCGAISGKYLATFATQDEVEVVACADLDPARAVGAAESAGSARPVTPAELLLADDVDLVLNLTVPAVHASTSIAALEAGKHVYTEKPLAATPAEGARMLEVARERGLRLGCAPDTVLASGLQTARGAVERGLIGRPMAAVAFLTSGGPDENHPNPAFFYQPGGGPLYDFGPYYVSALVHLLGPIRRVSALASSLLPERVPTRGRHVGESFPVAVPTHVSATLEHRSGALSTLITSFDVPGGSSLPRIEVFGTGGSLQVPDPNQFSSEVSWRAHRTEDWEPVAPTAGVIGGSRGIGVVDLAEALVRGTPHRAAADLGLHVLDVMATVIVSAGSGRAVEVASRCDVPALAPLAEHSAVGTATG